MVVNKERFNVSVSPEMLREIDNFKKTQNYPYRSTATVELIRLGLISVKKDQLKQIRQAQKSISKHQHTSKHKHSNSPN